jgi:hypothetical protein
VVIVVGEEVVASAEEDMHFSPERRWSPEVVVTGGREIIGCRREKGKRRR